MRRACIDIYKVPAEQYAGKVTSAESADEAFNAERFDVLISDIDMPGEDGYSFIRKVRALEKVQGGHIPAIALTALTRPAVRRRSLSAGFQIYLPKPIDLVDLVAAVASLTGRTGIE